MSLVFRQMGVYLKTVVGVVVLVFLVLFFVATRATGPRSGCSASAAANRLATNWVVFVSLVVGALVWWLARWMVTLPGQWRTLRLDARRQDLPPEQDVGGK